MGKKSNRIGKIPAFIKKLKDILEVDTIFNLGQEPV
jgi:hypothetical protein